MFLSSPLSRVGVSHLLNRRRSLSPYLVPDHNLGGRREGKDELCVDNDPLHIHHSVHDHLQDRPDSGSTKDLQQSLRKWCVALSPSPLPSLTHSSTSTHPRLQLPEMSEPPKKKTKLARQPQSGWVTSSRVKGERIALEAGLATEEDKRREEESKVDPAEFSMREDFKIYQVMGSSAGSGSGDFHTYRHTRRREMDRIQRLEQERLEREAEEEFRRRQAEAEAEVETARKRRAERRKRRKQRQLQAKEKAKLEAARIAPSDGSFLARMLELEKQGKLEAVVQKPPEEVAQVIAQIQPSSKSEDDPEAEDKDKEETREDRRGAEDAQENGKEANGDKKKKGENVPPDGRDASAAKASSAEESGKRKKKK